MQILGLGISSILSSAILVAIWKLLGFKGWTNSELIQTVLQVEQLHTTGGGWQDQIGGCISGGFKLGTLSPSKQNCIWEVVQISHEFREEMNQKLVLIYTGATRLAKNLLEVFSS